MNEQGSRDLRVRTKSFGLRIIRLYASLPKTVEAQVIGKQLLRSGTSVGAHYREAKRARSTAEFFHAVCHQIPERSFQIAGYPLAVCARCTGLYVGGLLGIAAYPMVRPLTRTDAPERVWLVLAVLPTTVDFALGFFGVWENTHWSRFLTALLAGAVAAFYIVPGLVDVGLARVRRPEGFSPAGI